jgi:ethanolamine transporter EutH
VSISGFDVFKEMVKRDKNIKVYGFSTNLKSAKTGSGGWGSVTIAVDNPTVQQVMIGKSVVGLLYIIDVADFTEIKDELSKSEGENGPNPDP